MTYAFGFFSKAQSSISTFVASDARRARVTRGPRPAPHTATTTLL